MESVENAKVHETTESEMSSNKRNEENTNEKKIREKYPENEGWEDVLGTASIMKKILTEGKEQTRPQRLDVCTINYKCTLEDGSHVETHDNIEVQLSDLEVIQGVDLALTLMNCGEKCLLRIEPRLAYGNAGLDSRVPPNTPVLYELELVKCELEEDMEKLSMNERKEKGDKKRQRGNWWYGRGECTFAIQCYRRALDYLDEVEGGFMEDDQVSQRDITDEALQNLMEDRINVSNNMAAAQMKLGAYDAALQSLQIVLRCQPNNVKALYRKAKILKEKNEVTDALKYLQKAKDLEPENATIQKEIQEMSGILKKQKNYEKELARRMFNGTEEKKKSAGKRKDIVPKKHSSFFLASIALSVAVGLASVVVWRFKLT